MSGRHSRAYSSTCAVFVAWFSLRNLPVIPFTEEGGHPVDAGALIGLGVVLGVLGGAFGTLAPGPVGLAVAVATLLPAAVFLQRRSRLGD